MKLSFKFQLELNSD